MNYQIDYQNLQNQTGFENFSQEITKLSSFNSETTYNEYCRAVLALWKKHFPQGKEQTNTFQEFLAKIDQEPQLSIKTPWGGVYIIKHEHPHVEKYLVVKQDGYLALEKHAEKMEKLIVKEGAGFLLYGTSVEGQLSAKILTPGVEASFIPGQLHCIIGTEDLLIYEISEDYKGMDQDLIFIFTPQA